MMRIAWGGFNEEASLRIDLIEKASLRRLYKNAWMRRLQRGSFNDKAQVMSLQIGSFKWEASRRRLQWRLQWGGFNKKASLRRLQCLWHQWRSFNDEVLCWTFLTKINCYGLGILFSASLLDLVSQLSPLALLGLFNQHFSNALMLTPSAKPTTKPIGLFWPT